MIDLANMLDRLKAMANDPQSSFKWAHGKETIEESAL